MAAPKLSPYSPRIPRYNLVAEDDGRVRLAEGRVHDGPILEGQLRNLSATGALIEIHESIARTRFLDEGEMIKIELAVPDRGRFAFFATVVRLDPSSKTQSWQLGLVFRNIPSELGRILDRSVNTRSKDYSHPRNFDLAAEKGFQFAARRATPESIWAMLRSTFASPQWWIASASFIVAAMVSIFWPLLMRF